jgi:ribosomal protein S18 acetylase RimI-like enzyme
MERVTVEPAGTDDVAAVTDLWVDLATSQREHGSHIRPAANRTVVRESIARHAVGDGLIVARDDGVVGFVMLTVETGAFEQDCARGAVENLYVAPGCRNKGVGTALLEAAEATLWDRGVDAVSLEVMAGNQSAREFYRQRGYDSHRVELEKSADADKRGP